MKYRRKNLKEIRIICVMPHITHNAGMILRGITRYRKVNHNWHIRMIFDSASSVLPIAKQAGFHGVFAVVNSEEDKDAVLCSGLPCIAFGGRNIPESVPYIATDSISAGRLAAEHFLERGFRNFAYYTRNDSFWSRRRLDGFNGRLAREGYSAITYTPETHTGKTDALENSLQAKWTQDWEGAARWLKSLPKPIGVLVCDDSMGYDLLNVAYDHDIHVPVEVAVIGVSNHRTICEAANPPLSSIEVNFDQAGYEAAELLNRIVLGQEQMSGQMIAGQVTRVVVRMSSDIMAIRDPEVAAALGYIQTNVNSTLRVEDIVSAAMSSRRALERKFRALLGRSIMQELTRMRVELVANMLLETEMSLDRIAATTAFVSTSHMTRVFTKVRGMTPGSFRRTHRF